MINAKGASYKLEGAEAIGFAIGNQFAVLAGAEVRPEKFSLVNARAKGYRELRKVLVRKRMVAGGKFVEDYVFDSPSQAGAIVLGTTGGGPGKWINQDTHVSLSEETKMRKRIAADIVCSFRTVVAMFGMAAMILFSGCGKQDRIEMAESNAKGGCNGICSVSGSLVSWRVHGGKGDLLYDEMIDENGMDYLELKANPSRTRGMSGEEAAEKYRSGWFIAQGPIEFGTYCADFKDYAFNKRAAALIVARCGLTYQFGNYYNLDGVSGLIYNVAYLFSIPRKILTYWRCADGLMGYLWGVVLVVLGGLLSIIGCVIAPIVNTICHPIETLSNLTIGVFYFDHWLTCVVRTNLLASLWDLVWGGIIYPLWQALIFWR